MSDRSRIEVYLELGWSISRIAKEIKFSKQAISREVRRNQNRQGNYTAITAWSVNTFLDNYFRKRSAIGCASFTFYH